MKILEKENVEEVVSYLKRDRVVCLPTDTVYGFFGNALREEAVDKIFEIKHRKKEDPIGIFVKDIAMAKRYAVLGEEAEEILSSYWPGRITFILPKRRRFPKGVGTEKTIGIRVPGYSLFNKIFQKINFPLAQTSANISGGADPLGFQEIINSFKKQALRPDLVFGKGKLAPRQPSTVIDLTGEAPRVVREGGVRFK